MTFLYKAHRPPSVGFLHSANAWPYSVEKEHVELRGKVAIVTGGAVRIGFLTDGFSSITIGRADGSGIVTVQGLVTFKDP